MTHTPEKWEAISGVLNGDHILVRGGDYAVAKVYNQEEGMEATNEANARLIAAAPDLLEALEEIDKACFKYTGDDQNDYVAAAYDKLTAAIAKARGEAA